MLRKAHADWEGETGYVDKALLEKHIPLHRGSRQYYVCAAPVMMDAVELLPDKVCRELFITAQPIALYVRRDLSLEPLF